MSAFRILVWTANLAGVALLWSIATSAPPSRHLPLMVALVASVMALTLAYVWMLEAAQRRRSAETGGRTPQKSV